MIYQRLEFTYMAFALIFQLGVTVSPCLMSMGIVLYFRGHFWFQITLFDYAVHESLPKIVTTWLLSVILSVPMVWYV